MIQSPGIIERFLNVILVACQNNKYRRQTASFLDHPIEASALRGALDYPGEKKELSVGVCLQNGFIQVFDTLLFCA